LSGSCRIVLFFESLHPAEPGDSTVKN